MSNDRKPFRPFNPLSLLRVTAIVKHSIPRQELEKIGLDPDRIRTDAKGNTRIPCRISFESGLVETPVRPNYFLMSAEEYRSGRLTQVVAGEDGQRLRGRFSKDGRLFFSINQRRIVHLVRVREGKQDFVEIYRVKLMKNEDGDKNYLFAERIFPTGTQGNDFTFFHYTSRLRDDVAGHLPEEKKFLAEAVTAALKKVHADEDYPAYAEIQEPKQKPEQKPEEPEKTETQPEEISSDDKKGKEKSEDAEKSQSQDQKDKTGTQVKHAKIEDRSKEAEKEIQEAEKDSSETEQPAEKGKSPEVEKQLEKVRGDNEKFSRGPLADALDEAFKKPLEIKKTEKPKSKTKSKTESKTKSKTKSTKSTKTKTTKK